MPKNPIKNLLKVRPFSHNPGSSCVIPSTTIAVEVFPTRICFYDLGTPSIVQVAEVSFVDLGPLEEFTVTCDLVQHSVLVSGFQNKRAFRYEIQQYESKEIRISFHKLISIIHKVDTKIGESSLWKFYDSQKKIIETTVPIVPKSYLILKPHKEGLCFDHWPKKKPERLFLGNTKKQDFDLMTKRGDIQELLPFYYQMAQSVPKVLHLKEHTPESRSISALLEIAIREKKGIEEMLLSFFKVGFTKLMIPTLFDTLFQGYPDVLTEHHSDFSPLILFEKLFSDVRKIFFQESTSELLILPSLPPSFHSGVLVDVVTEKGHVLSIEWSKKVIRRLCVQTHAKVHIPFVFQNSLASYRIQDLKSNQVLGRFQNKSKVTLEENGMYLFDRFEK